MDSSAVPKGGQIWIYVLRRRVYALASTCFVMLYLSFRNAPGSSPGNSLIPTKDAASALSTQTATSPIQHRDQPPTLKVLVSYVYYETERQSECEILNKRTNLVFFLRYAVATSPSNIRFHFTFPGLNPSPREILSSLGISEASETGKCVVEALSNEPDNLRIHNSSVGHPSADLCHHHHILEMQANLNFNFDFMLSLNDGVRGPIFDLSSASVLARRLPYDGVPPWLAKFVALMIRNEKTRLVGPVLSCERDSHIQSACHFYDIRALSTFMPHLKATCVPGISWDEAIDHEVAISTDLLENGNTIASLYPAFENFSIVERLAVKAGNQVVVRKLDHCKNMLLADNLLSNVQPLTGVIMYKFGGDIWRRKLYAQSFVKRIQSKTENMLGFKSNSACYSGFTPMYSSSLRTIPWTG